MNYKRLKRHLIQLDTVDSTNNYAANLLKTSIVANGTTVMTKRQTAGKGQRGNSWTTEDGKNLILSIILFPDLQTKETINLTLAISLAVYKTISHYLAAVSIKWPNDILASEKKIAGILIENQLRGDRISSSIVGIGINVNQENFEAGINATSFKKELNQDFNLQDLFSELFINLDFYMNLLMEKNFKILLSRYYERMYRINVPSDFEDSSGRFRGTIKGIDEAGKLIVTREGISTYYDLKEIKFI